jgi:hypothetical protein
MHEFRENKCLNDLVFVDDFDCQNDLVFVDDFDCQNDLVSHPLTQQGAIKKFY